MNTKWQIRISKCQDKYIFQLNCISIAPVLLKRALVGWWVQQKSCKEWKYGNGRGGGGSDLGVVKDHQKSQFVSDLFPNGLISLSLL